MVGSKTMPMSIRVIDESTLEHLAVGRFNAWYEMSWRKGGLFSFSVVVLRVSVERESSNLYERVVTLWYDLCNVVKIESVLFSFCKRYNLNIPGPRWEVALLNVFEKVSGSEILILLSHFSSFSGSPSFDSLIRLEVVFDKERFTLVVNPLVSVRTVAIHVSVSVWSSSVREKDHNLVEGLR